MRLLMAFIFTTPFFTGCSQTFGGPLPLLFVIGDSTSLNYNTALTNNLSGRYRVQRPNDNCRNSYYTSINASGWLVGGARAPNVIIWNNGLWDSASVGYVPQGESPTSVRTTNAEYEQNLRNTAAILLATGAKVYFMTTTYVNNSAGGNEFGREAVLNSIATSVMNELGITIIDLYTVSTGLEAYKTDQIHYNSAGSQILADVISGSL